MLSKTNKFLRFFVYLFLLLVSSVGLFAFKKSPDNVDGLLSTVLTPHIAHADTPITSCDSCGSNSAACTGDCGDSCSSGAASDCGGGGDGCGSDCGGW